MAINYIQNKLLKLFFIFLSATVIILIAFECGIFPTGALLEKGTDEFYFTIAMQLLTIACIPVALRLFKFKKIHRQLTGDNKYNALMRWASRRMTLIFIPLLLNLAFYYLFMQVSFAYLAIILALCLFFIYPSKIRCNSEIEA